MACHAPIRRWRDVVDAKGRRGRGAERTRVHARCITEPTHASSTTSQLFVAKARSQKPRVLRTSDEDHPSLVSAFGRALRTACDAHQLRNSDGERTSQQRSVRETNPIRSPIPSLQSKLLLQPHFDTSQTNLLRQILQRTWHLPRRRGRKHVCFRRSDGWIHAKAHAPKQRCSCDRTTRRRAWTRCSRRGKRRRNAGPDATTSHGPPADQMRVERRDPATGKNNCANRNAGEQRYTHRGGQRARAGAVQ